MNHEKWVEKMLLMLLALQCFTIGALLTGMLFIISQVTS